MDIADIDRDLARLADTFRAGFISEEEHGRRVSELNERRKLALTIQALQSTSIGGADAPAASTVSTASSIDVASPPAQATAQSVLMPDPTVIPPPSLPTPAPAQADARRPTSFSYSVYISKVLKQVHPDTGISNKVRRKCGVW